MYETRIQFLILNFSNMKNKYLCLLFLLFSLLSMSAHAQIKVEGNVFDENDIPLIGVSVVTEGGKTGL